MVAKITFFPVDNGDMTLIRLADSNETSLLIDCNIRQAADDSSDNVPDVASDLRDRIKKDDENRPYIDAMLLSHPDKDHCSGFEKHFWLGPLSDYSDGNKPENEKRIVIREIWSSPMIFRRASEKGKHTLCPDAKAFNKEAKRRVKVNINNGFSVEDGDRILILGEDQDGKTDDLTPILTKTGEEIKGINGCATEHLISHVLAPMAPQDEDTEDTLSKNDSSVIINFKIRCSESEVSVSRFLTGGDAGVVIWEKISNEYKPLELRYDLLLVPHHCSWHTLSHDSWSEKGESAEVSQDAKKALAQANDNAFIISSSKPIHDDDNNPPCIRAKREYLSILRASSGTFKCTGEEPTEANPKPLELETTSSGFKLATALPMDQNSIQFAEKWLSKVQDYGLKELQNFPNNFSHIQPGRWPFERNLQINVQATVSLEQNGEGGKLMQSGQIISAGHWIKFQASTPLSVLNNFCVKWRVVNTGGHAFRDGSLRGDFYESKPSAIRHELTQYRGVHWVEAFVINPRTGGLVGKSERFFVLIK